MTTRNCGNCACSLLITRGPQSQLFCRKNPPKHAVAKIQVPRMKLGVHQKNGRDELLFDMEEKDVFVNDPTHEALVCFDGWRAMGTEPGDRGLIQNPQIGDRYELAGFPQPEDFAPPLDKPPGVT